MRLSAIIAISVFVGRAASLSAQSVEQYRPHDISFTSSYDYNNPFLDVVLRAVFLGPGGEVLEVPGFFDGGRTWKVRFSATLPGTWTYSTICSDAQNPGLHQQSGSLNANPNTNPRIHGRLRVDPQHSHHFIYEDGEPCFLFGYEADWAFALDPYDAQAPRLSALIDDVSNHGFNMLTINLYAHDTSWSPGNGPSWDYGPPAEFLWQGTNDQPNHQRMNLTFFQAFDVLMEKMWDRGLLAHIMVKVYNKFVNWPFYLSENDNLFWYYVVARYQAYPNLIWDTAKESYYAERDIPGYSVDRVNFIRAVDGYQNLVTVHDPDRSSADDAGDFKSDQIHRNRYENALANYQTWNRPYLNVEYGYEQGVEDLPTYPVNQPWDQKLNYTWLVTMGGAYANYYYSNTAWDVIKRTPEPPGYDPHLVYANFWRSTRFWELDPRPDAVVSGQAYCRAREGSEYVFYTSVANSFRIRIQGASAPLEGYWLNTQTGDEAPLSQGYGDGDHDLTPPFSFAALYLSEGSGPVARFVVSNDQPEVSEAVVFDASSSFSVGSDITRYEWDFNNDGQVDAEGEIVQHAYSSPEKFDAWLQVTDSSDRTDTEIQSISVREVGSGLNATYFNNSDLTDLAFTQTDAQVDFDWSAGPPDPRIDNDQIFSVRWTGWYEAESAGLYEFCTLSNDGVRLWIRDSLVIDNWTQHGNTEDCSGSISLQPGWHRLQLEYFQEGGTSRIQLSASGPGFGLDVVPSDHLRVGLVPTIEDGGVVPNPFFGQSEAVAWANVSDPDGEESISRVESFWLGPGGGFIGSYTMDRWPSDPGLFVLTLGNPSLPPAIWTVYFRATDQQGLQGVFGPFFWETR